MWGYCQGFACLWSHSVSSSKFCVLTQFSSFLARNFFFHDPLTDCWSKSLGRKHPGVGLHLISLTRMDTHAQTRGDTRAPAAHRAESRGTWAIAATRAERGGAKPGTPLALGAVRAALSALQQQTVGYCAWGEQQLGSPLKRGCLAKPTELETLLDARSIIRAPCICLRQHYSDKRLLVKGCWRPTGELTGEGHHAGELWSRWRGQESR